MTAVGRYAAVFAVAMALAVVALAGSARADPGVVDLRVGQHPDKIRFVLDLTERVESVAFQLPDP